MVVETAITQWRIEAMVSISRLLKLLDKKKAFNLCSAGAAPLQKIKHFARSWALSNG